jgi:3-deoxy-manno-octulosonate cytidylyltransferase (CMP-KDO synthetase)
VKVVGVIPSRYASSRFPGKPLALLLGKPLLSYVIEAAKKSPALDEVIVATDHSEIAELAERCGARVVMTDSSLPSGSDRVWAAVQDLECDVVLNIQGDEPLLKPEIIDVLVAPFRADRELQMATLGRVLQPGDLESQTTAKIVVNKRHEALYFSRYPIPYSRVKPTEVQNGCLKHIGIYAYRKIFLETFCRMGPIAIERCEGLEQLRALYLGARIRVILVEEDSWGVDTPDDVSKVEQLLRKEQV